MTARVFCLILAHVGRTIDRDRARQVRAVQKSKHEIVFADTSNAQSVLRDLIGYCWCRYHRSIFPKAASDIGKKIFPMFAFTRNRSMLFNSVIKLVKS
ncbi:MAG TPA: hypothetical protein DIT01_04630 [Lentisphaeria bacterium]|nr:hypothetical protein [Lentisphaeria bacterium]|tara:strand:+ start:1196 stop:1489 length:294 start_codon:yes stop_codon:yes gene_type:complete